MMIAEWNGMGYWTFGCVKCWKWKYPYGAFIYLCGEGQMDGWMEFGLLLFFGVYDC